MLSFSVRDIAFYLLALSVGKFLLVEIILSKDQSKSLANEAYGASWVFVDPRRGPPPEMVPLVPTKKNIPVPQLSNIIVPGNVGAPQSRNNEVQRNGEGNDDDGSLTSQDKWILPSGLTVSTKREVLEFHKTPPPPDVGVILNSLSSVNPEKKGHREENPRDAQITAVAAFLGSGIRYEIADAEISTHGISGKHFIKSDDSLFSDDEKIADTIQINSFEIQNEGYLATHIDLPPGEMDYQIPLIDEQSLAEFASNQGIELQGGIYFAKLGSLCKIINLFDVDDSIKAFYLDSQLNVVSSGEAAAYFLALNISPGNTFAEMTFVNSERVTKFIPIESDKVYFDGIFIDRAQALQMSFYNTPLFAESTMPVELGEEQIKNFSGANDVHKIAANTFEVSRHFTFSNARTYFELNYKNLNFFLGVDANRDIQLPDQRLFDIAMLEFNRDHLKDNCLIQINLDRPITHITVNSRVDRDDVEMRFLDPDGEFYQDSSESSKYLFFNSEGHGSIDYVLEYIGGEKRHLRTFCSAGSFVVEQL